MRILFFIYIRSLTQWLMPTDLLKCIDRFADIVMLRTANLQMSASLPFGISLAIDASEDIFQKFSLSKTASLEFYSGLFKLEFQSGKTYYFTHDSTIVERVRMLSRDDDGIIDAVVEQSNDSDTLFVLRVKDIVLNISSLTAKDAGLDVGVSRIPLLFQSTGVLLWGPPGCGKSDTSNDYRSRFNPMYFINTDEIVEFILKRWRNAQYASIKEGSIGETEKQKIYWGVRSMIFSDLIDDTHDTPHTEIEILREIFGNISIPVSDISDEEFETFKKASTEVKIVDIVSSLLIFLAKYRRQSFMIETTGNSFSVDWVKEVFNNLNSILQVVFVSGATVLCDRVKGRTGQLINATPSRIVDSYIASYFRNLKLALLSGVFEQIIVSSNDVKPVRVLMQLMKKSEDEKIKYKLTVNFPNNLNSKEKDFAENVFSTIGLPVSSIEGGRRLSAAFCLQTYKWDVNLL